MRIAAWLVLTLAALPAAETPDVREIVRRAAREYERAVHEADAYSYRERMVIRDLDGDGNVKSEEIKTHEYTMIEGSPYRRLLLQNDKPVSPEEAKGQAEALDKTREARRQEPAEVRRKRIREYEERRDRNLPAVREVPDAFNFHLAGTETIDGRPAWVIEGTPRDGYHPKDRRAKLFTGLKGKVWIDQADYQVVKAEGELIEPVYFALFLVRIGKGAWVKVEQTRVAEGLWLPKRIDYQVSARIGFIKSMNEARFASYSAYQKQQTAAPLQ